MQKDNILYENCESKIFAHMNVVIVLIYKNTIPFLLFASCEHSLQANTVCNS